MGLENVLIITDSVDENLYPVLAQSAQRARGRAAQADPVSLLQFENTLLTRGAVAKIEEMLA